MHDQDQRPRGNHLMTNTSVSASPLLVLKSPEAATALGICPRKLWDLTDQGKIPHVRIGNSVRYPVDALKKWLDDQIQGGNANIPADAQGRSPSKSVQQRPK